MMGDSLPLPAPGSGFLSTDVPREYELSQLLDKGTPEKLPQLPCPSMYSCFDELCTVFSGVKMFQSRSIGLPLFKLVSEIFFILEQRLLKGIY